MALRPFWFCNEMMIWEHFRLLQSDDCCMIQLCAIMRIFSNEGKIEKVPRGIRGEKSSKDMASSRNLVSTIGALASPKMGDGTRCPEG